ncbi:MAG: single-stranded DNA-binding protein [Bacteroidales bacterium]|jgi:single-strand DNA-binding protein|nr:single-stranded DNA-binding protein [Bacteroidales bacterium]
MAGINKVILIGNVGVTPDILMFNETKKAIFSLATTIHHTSKSWEKTENTQWHNVVCWRNLADIVEQYVTKGALLYVEGYLSYHTWEDKAGNNRKEVEIIASQLQILSKNSYQKPKEDSIAKIIFGEQAPEIDNMSVLLNQTDRLNSFDDLPL